MSERTNDHFASGTIDKEVFTVQNGGMCSFAVNVGGYSDTNFGLYQVVAPSGGELGHYVGHLVTYASSVGENFALPVTFALNLAPGTYYLKVTGILSLFGGALHPFVIMTAKVPAYNASQIDLDPKSGFNDLIASSAARS